MPVGIGGWGDIVDLDLGRGCDGGPVGGRVAGGSFLIAGMGPALVKALEQGGDPVPGHADDQVLPGAGERIRPRDDLRGLRRGQKPRPQ